MSDDSRLPRPRRHGFIALATCVAVGLFIGFMCGLTLARRMIPAPTESRLVMQLLAFEHATLTMQAKAGQCEPPSPHRLGTLLALVDLVPLSMRDTLVVDDAFEAKVQRLRLEVQRLATAPGRDCRERRQLLDAIDSACRNCHLEFRTGESD